MLGANRSSSQELDYYVEQYARNGLHSTRIASGIM